MFTRRPQLLVLTTVALLGASPGFAQTDSLTSASLEADWTADSTQVLLDRIARIVVQDAAMSEALHRLTMTSGVNIAFSPSEISKARRLINCDCATATVRQALDQILHGTPLDYMAIRGQVVVFARSGWQANPILALGSGPGSGLTIREPIPFANYATSRSASSSPQASARQQEVSGTVTSSDLVPLQGVSVDVQGTTIGTITNATGNYTLLPPEPTSTLVFSSLGMVTQEVPIQGRSVIDVTMEVQPIALEEMIVVGYGTQRRSDLTGSVASLQRDRLELLPHQSFSQILQGAVPGVMLQTTGAGVEPTTALLVRGRNSIAADNTPLLVVDGIPYGGGLNDIRTTDIASIEVLKDASAAAIYGARGSNGVILVTTNTGAADTPTLTYQGSISAQRYANLPDLMTGEEFFEFKTERFADAITNSEREVYERGEWVDWLDLGTQTGVTHKHDLSVSGGFQNTTYYLSGSIEDLDGVIVNDRFTRLGGRLNVDTRFSDWLSIGTRTQLFRGDRSGMSPTTAGISGLFTMNPNTTPYNDDGSLAIYPWADDAFFGNPLSPTTYDNYNNDYNIASTNFLEVTPPFLEGLTYRLNSGVHVRNHERGTYQGRNTKSGLENRGVAQLATSRRVTTTLENIVSYNLESGAHSAAATGVVSAERDEFRSELTQANGFPNDLLSWHALPQAEFMIQTPSFDQTHLLSQMLRLNYVYDQRYLLTVTGRRDGFSGFGAEKKWGLFPSVAVGWNLHNEDFFPWPRNVISEFKPRISWGINGNHAVGSFQSLTRMQSADIIFGDDFAAGFYPSQMANEDLGWETSKTINVGLDLGLFDNRIIADLNAYHTNTSDLLLARTISSVHGITSILQNIGKTSNTGLELAVATQNISTPNFSWTTSANLAFNTNKIRDLYGDGKDDIANAWFIGHPINVNYDFVVDGVWQLDEAEEAARWGSQPGFVKFRDLNGDGEMSAVDDRQIIGQHDPRFIFGISNGVSYKGVALNIFIHGVSGVTRANEWLTDDTFADVRINTTNKNRWTPDNPTNDFIMNHLDARIMAGHEAEWYEDASFVRVKDLTLSYELPQRMISGMGVDRVRVYGTGSNLYTFTKWTGLDPELLDQQGIPLQREFSLGLQLAF